MNLWTKALVLFSEGLSSKPRQMQLLILINWAWSDSSSKWELLKCLVGLEFPKAVLCLSFFSVLFHKDPCPLECQLLALLSKSRVRWQKLLIPSLSFSPERVLLAASSIWVTWHQDCEGSVGCGLASCISLACSHNSCECLEDVVDGVEGGGRNKSGRL